MAFKQRPTKVPPYQDAKVDNVGIVEIGLWKEQGGQVGSEDKFLNHIRDQGEVIPKRYELKVVRILPSGNGSSSSKSLKNSQNVAIVPTSTNNTNNTHKADDTTHGVSTTHSTTHTQSNGVNSICLDNLCDAEDGMLTNQQQKLSKRTGRSGLNMDNGVGYDKSKVECLNYIKHGHLQENVVSKKLGFKGRKINTRTIAVETPTQNALIAQDGIGGYHWRYQAEEEQPTNHPLMAFRSSGSSSSSDFESLNNILENQVIDKSKTGLGYDAATAAVLHRKFCKVKLISLDHMTGNKCYLDEYEDYDGGFVSFGDGKGRISRKVLLVQVPAAEGDFINTSIQGFI
ncbi:hypothetical protein Tco_1562120 [Tanacetum coccineum]